MQQRPFGIIMSIIVKYLYIATVRESSKDSSENLELELNFGLEGNLWDTMTRVMSVSPQYVPAAR